MFYLNRNEELSAELLKKMFQKFNQEVQPKLKKYKNYYDGIQAILKKEYTDETKPCNKTVINYCKNIVDSYCGYLATPGYITYKSNEDITDIMEVLKYNDYQAQDADFLLDALVYGKAAELMYLDTQGQVRFRLISPLQCFAVYDDSLTGDMLYFVRWYEASQWDDTNKYYVDVYSDYSIKHYEMHGDGGYIAFLGEDLHYFSQCPANVFSLPDEKNIFDCVMSLQDSANELLSGEIDDYSAFCDAYLILEGMDAEDEDIKQMKENRVMLIPEGGKAYWLTKAANDAQVENIMKRIHDSIYRIAQCPDFSSESFVGGVSSGVAIRYRLTGMETKAGKIEAVMKKALQRRIEIICGIASLKLGEEVFKDIEIDFKRNIPEDITTTINLVNGLTGKVSDKTLLAQLPFVDNVDEELEAIQEQKLNNLEMYDFGGFTANTAEEEEVE